MMASGVVGDRVGVVYVPDDRVRTAGVAGLACGDPPAVADAG
jgi:hypothetical protein